MEIFVEGVRIQLTAEQIALVEKDRRRRQRCRNSFAKMPKHFGFKLVEGSRSNGWEHGSMGWYAEIHDHGRWSEVWLVGKGLKCGGFPGGWTYGEPKEIETEILSALEKL